MLKNIILEITANKKARNIEPIHAIYKEVYEKAISNIYENPELLQGAV